MTYIMAIVAGGGIIATIITVIIIATVIPIGLQTYDTASNTIDCVQLATNSTNTADNTPVGEAYETCVQVEESTWQAFSLLPIVIIVAVLGIVIAVFRPFF